MIGLILDTNVLVSSNLNSDGLEALVVSLGLNRKIRLYVSEPILAEYEQVRGLVRKNTFLSSKS
jgi:predicted nucleic acid-binding protein